MKLNQQIPFFPTNELIESQNKNLLTSLSLISKKIGFEQSNPIIAGISFPLHKSFSELYEQIKHDPIFISKFNLLTMSQTRLIYVVENYNEESLFDDIYSINNDSTSQLIFQVLTISYLDLVNNKQIIEILQSAKSTEFNQHLFFFENCT
jgi:hypothetical protein